MSNKLDAIDTVVSETQWRIIRAEAAGYRAIVAILGYVDGGPPQVSHPDRPVPVPSPLPDETPMPIADDGPSPDEAAGADLAPVATQAPVQPPAQPEAPKSSRGRPRKKSITDVPPVDADDIPAAPVPPPEPQESPKPADPVIDDIPWGGPVSAPGPKSDTGPIASGFGDDDAIPADDAADPSSLF